jgi:hypothetical protein
LLNLIFINNELNQNDSFLYTAEQSVAKHEAKVGGIKIIKKTSNLLFPPTQLPAPLAPPSACVSVAKFIFYFLGGPKFLLCV